MSNIKVVASVVNSSGILAEVQISATNDFIATATYSPSAVSPSYILMKADVFTPFSLFDFANTSEILLLYPKPVYSDYTLTSDSNAKIIGIDYSDSAVASDLFASTLVKNVDFDTSTAQVDSEPVTTSEIFVLVLNDLDFRTLNRYSFNSISLN